MAKNEKILSFTACLSIMAVFCVLLAQKVFDGNHPEKEVPFSIEEERSSDRKEKAQAEAKKSKKTMPPMYTTQTVYGCEIKAMFPMVKASEKAEHTWKASKELNEGLEKVGANAYVAVNYQFSKRHGHTYVGTPVVLDCEPESPKVDEAGFGLSD